MPVGPNLPEVKPPTLTPALPSKRAANGAPATFAGPCMD